MRLRLRITFVFLLWPAAPVAGQNVLLVARTVLRASRSAPVRNPMETLTGLVTALKFFAVHCFSLILPFGSLLTPNFRRAGS